MLAVQNVRMDRTFSKLHMFQSEGCPDEADVFPDPSAACTKVVWRKPAKGWALM